MFQSYEEVNNPAVGGPRIALLRSLMAEQGLDGYLVPRADEYLSEFVPPCAERLAWLTGFSGSAGLAIILKSSAALFVDGRYKIQAGHQVDPKLMEICQIPRSKPEAWLAAHVKRKYRIGFDPRLHTHKNIQTLTTALNSEDAELAPVKRNLIDIIWTDRPPEPAGSVHLHPLKYSGKRAAEKLVCIQKTLRKTEADAALLTQPESISWLFNIRGDDVRHTPVVLARAIIHSRKKPELFINRQKLTTSVIEALKKISHLKSPEELSARIKKLGQDGSKVQIEPNKTPAYYSDLLDKSGARISEDGDPCILPKSIKNSTEIAGARQANIRDGIAVSRFLCWLEKNSTAGLIDEIGAAKKLEQFRRDTGKLRDISFDTISGAGSNGAITHYRVTRESNRGLRKGSLFLIDSGGQYLDGTTDVTRTVAIGKPTAEMRHHFTLVLKGHIAISRARFPEGTRGMDIDPFARQALWSAGLDFEHGTGHGVGSYLSVHEGPQGISRLSTTPLQPGMILSNEPGYYRAEKYGIRIENLVLVSDPAEIKGGQIPMLGFENLTFVPIDVNLIERSNLTPDEVSWLNNYHRDVRKQVLPEIDSTEKAWLLQATKPLE